MNQHDGFSQPSRHASLPRNESQRDVVNRLKRIEGQIRGLIDMVQTERSCEEVAQQMAAARKGHGQGLLSHDGLFADGSRGRIRRGRLGHARRGALHAHP